MNNELRKAIVVYMLENENDFQLVNNTTKQFKQYIYNEEGEHCFGGEATHHFITAFATLIKTNK
jgi:hypothetical protein